MNSGICLIISLKKGGGVWLNRFIALLGLHELSKRTDSLK